MYVSNNFTRMVGDIENLPCEKKNLRKKEKLKIFTIEILSKKRNL